MLETDASVQGLGAVLSQQDETGRLCVLCSGYVQLQVSKIRTAGA